MKISLPPAVVFDCDGTLVDSEGLHAKALQLALSEFGIQLAAEEILRRSAGVASGEFLQRLADEQGVTFAADTESRVEEIALSFIGSTVRLATGAGEVIRELAADGTLLALASNSSRRLVDTMLQSVGLAAIFAGRIVAREDVNAPKPAPDIYRLAARRLDVEVEDCVAVEDSPVGIRAAHLAGMKVVGYRPRYAAFQVAQLVGAGASVVITDMRELLNCLD